MNGDPIPAGRGRFFGATFAMMSAFSFVSRWNSAIHSSTEWLLILGTFTVRSNQPAASPNWK